MKHLLVPWRGLIFKVNRLIKEGSQCLFNRLKFRGLRLCAMIPSVLGPRDSWSERWILFGGMRNLYHSTFLRLIEDLISLLEAALAHVFYIIHLTPTAPNYATAKSNTRGADHVTSKVEFDGLICFSRASVNAMWKLVLLGLLLFDKGEGKVSKKGRLNGSVCLDKLGSAIVGRVMEVQSGGGFVSHLKRAGGR